MLQVMSCTELYRGLVSLLKSLKAVAQHECYSYVSYKFLLCILEDGVSMWQISFPQHETQCKLYKFWEACLEQLPVHQQFLNKYVSESTKSKRSNILRSLKNLSLFTSQKQQIRLISSFIPGIFFPLAQKHLFKRNLSLQFSQANVHAFSTKSLDFSSVFGTFQRSLLSQFFKFQPVFAFPCICKRNKVIVFATFQNLHYKTANHFKLRVQSELFLNRHL